MRYHNITKADMLNGDGLRVVLWVSGCSHHCKGCQNPITWNPLCGLVFDEAAKEEIFKELDNSWCSGITLSGGDPLFPGNRHDIRMLVQDINEMYPEKTIWCYTGFTWDELMEQVKTDEDLAYIINHIDVLCEGRYVDEERNINKHWVGSNNQRVVEVKDTLTTHKIKLLAS